MISEKLLGLVGETEKLDELKAIMDEIDVMEAENTDLKTKTEEQETHIKELNAVNAKLLLSSVAFNPAEDKKDEKPDISEMDEDEFFDYLKNKSKEE